MSVDHYVASWAKYGIAVEVFETKAEFASFAAPFTNMWDKRGTASDAPAPGPMRWVDFVTEPATYLYHGGVLRAEWFGRGVASIDFSKATDDITGPAFFTTLNPFLAAMYGDQGADVVKGREHTGPAGRAMPGYGQIMQLEVTDGTCVGLVPDWATLDAIARLGEREQLAFIEARCPSCAFVAVNWNTEGVSGGGIMPYEVRVLPAAPVQCGLKLRNVVAYRLDDRLERVDRKNAASWWGDMTPLMVHLGDAFTSFRKLMALRPASDK